MKIAVIDDEKAFGDLVGLQAQMLSITQPELMLHVDVYNDPEKFVQIIDSETVCEYDIIIIDANMPKVDGFEVRKELKTRCRGIKCFMVTSAIYKPEVFGEYESIITKDQFSLNKLIDRALGLSRFMNNLELDLYCADVLHG